MLTRSTRSRLSLCLVLGLCAFASSALASSPPEDVQRYDADTLIQRALDNHPRQQAIDAHARSARRQAEAARGAIPQPSLDVAIAAPLAPSSWGEWEYTLGVSQEIPWGRVRQAAGDPFDAQTALWAAEARALELQVAFEIRELLLQIARLDARTHVVREQREAYQDALEYEVRALPFSSADHTDVIRLTTMIELMDDELESIASQRQELREALAVPTRLPVDAPWRVAPVDVAALRQATLPPLGEILEQVRTQHPALLAAVAQADVARAQARIAPNELLPMPSLSVAVGILSMPGMSPGEGRDRLTSLQVGLSMPLPVFRSSVQAAEAGLLAEADAAERDADNLMREFEMEIRRSLVRLEEANRRVQRYRAVVIPSARDGVDHLAITLARGALDTTSFLLASEQLLELSLDAIDAEFSAALERIRVDLLRAAPLSDLQFRASAPLTTNGGSP